MTLLLDEIALAAARLAEAGVDSPRADAELIAAHVHNVKRGELHTVPDKDFDARFWVDIGRRENREPLQHITGQAYFRYLELDVGPGVFVPRPETEVMTGWAIDRLRAMNVAEPVAVDLGTGSGAIALSIAQEVPRASVHAVEGDPLARSWAERNITRYVDGYTAGRVLLHAGDFTTPDPRAGLGELAGLARSCSPRWRSTTRPRRSGAAVRASTPSARWSGRPAGCFGPAAWWPSSTLTCRARPFSGSSPRKPAGATPPTTRTSHVKTGSSLPCGRGSNPPHGRKRRRGQANSA
jgi:PrmC N-terminal domain